MDRDFKFRAFHLDDGILHFDFDSFQKDYHDQYGNIMQFTGLTDKNGKDIYEGDILATGHLGFKCAVTFEDGCFQLKTNNEQGSSHLSQGRASRLEVIGNIYENTELLK